ncbi:phospholipase D/nuclease [Eremomyces bilateralis CBS 781.70]|uniref:Phospholipase n=1 Tax=Eremomyces bilateralis CBS 781.70 TaxID=1392243 RepID=A0A6G1GAJ8_9PEZI|nr:phospholipase D/nuclease [Eremomyces bilateralis CBS 781.70]KAF1815108.1 phospholipase D/nuclease [Eremomyces bilateralis CBS 781.70]
MPRYNEDDLAYGEYHGQGGEESSRHFIGDVFHRLRGTKPDSEYSHEAAQTQTPPGSTTPYDPHLIDPNPTTVGNIQSHDPPAQSSSTMSSLFGKVHQAVHGVGAQIKDKINTLGDNQTVHAHTSVDGQCSDGAHSNSRHRFHSFAPQREGNELKWYVDGCNYMWAVSVAIEQARESIWILDWWLSPELYLRRPPKKFENYRIDRMLKAAAERGVKVNIIVYKEVTQALTLSSAHTKHHLEDLHPNIGVFRHPDHLPDTAVLSSSFISSLQNLKLTAASAAKLPGDALKAVYGTSEGTVLYWAHHEKLCLIDGNLAFMGGLDLCYGRWDTHQHPIADLHPANIDDTVFPGQDYNNARIMDFQDVPHWENNKLDRTKSARMGWSDVSLCVRGPAVEDLKVHFAERWNFIWQEKYSVKNEGRYHKIDIHRSSYGVVGEGQTGADSAQGSYQPSGAQGLDGAPSEFQAQSQGQYFPPPPTQASRGIDHAEGERGFGGEDGERGFRHGRLGGAGDKLWQRVEGGLQQFEDKYQLHHESHHSEQQQTGPLGGAICQLTRSCAEWSHGTPLEHSIANAYIETITAAKHFIYIENQFFITATTPEQKPVANLIGSAIVARIKRAARENQPFKIFVMMPAVPAFAGDLRSDDALSTRAIMEFQYQSICRDQKRQLSIYEQLAREDIDPVQYIRFYNLRNFDRLNTSAALRTVEQSAGVSYEDARKQYDEQVGGGFGQGQPEGQETSRGYDPSGYQPYHPAPAEADSNPGYPPPPPRPQDQYNPPSHTGYGAPQDYSGAAPYSTYQSATSQASSDPTPDTVSNAYMQGGQDIRSAPWSGDAQSELSSIVSEELYIHSKLLIADDSVVICGSANLNDRSQLGNHDSEIAIIIRDRTPVPGPPPTIAGRPNEQANAFATSLRRFIFRKHLGLVPPQQMDRPDRNAMPLDGGMGGMTNDYDWGSEEDRAVHDPLSEPFLALWDGTARRNTESFRKVFHPVPDDTVRTWTAYEEYYTKFFAPPKQEGAAKEGQPVPKAKYDVGHVVEENFPGGVHEVKEILSQVKGTLVEMPLLFLKDEDIAKEGLGLNAFTEEVYT